VRKRLLGIPALVIVPVILGLSAGIPAASASTPHAAAPDRATHSSGVGVAATPQFLAALKRAREAGRGVIRPDTATGICWSYTGNGLCWRDMPGGAIDMWNREISGDSRQQWAAIYEGTTGQTGCPISGNIGVYAFLGYNGYYAGAAYYSDDRYYVGDGDSYDYWAWDPDGVLENCADTRTQHTAYAWPIAATTWKEGTQLFTVESTNGSTFDQVAGS
jgi:hypothetical protein